MTTIDTQTLLAKLAQTKKELVRNEKAVKPQQGTTDIVLLPGWNPERREVFWREFGGHYIKQGNKVVAFYPCDEVINNKPCPICQKLAEAASMTTDDATLNMIKQARAGREFLVNAIVVSSDNKNPVVFSMSKTAFEQMIDVITAWSAAVFDETNPMIVRINRSGTGFDTRYTVTILNQRYPLPPDTVSKITDLDKYVDQKTDALLQKSMNAIAELTGGAMTRLPPSAPAPQALIHTQPQQPAFDSPAAGAPWGAETIQSVQPAQPTQPAVAPQPQPVQPQFATAQHPIYAAQPAQPPVQQPAAPAPQPASVPMDADMEELMRQLNL